mgnify:CR=1 FL=1
MFRNWIILNQLIGDIISTPHANAQKPTSLLLEAQARGDDIRYVPIPKPIGENQDEGGCCISCGYSWCPSLNDCVRPWETYCQELDFPYNTLYKGSGIILPLPQLPQPLPYYDGTGH